MTIPARVLGFIAACLIGSSVHADYLIKEITISGNHKTKREIIIQEMPFSIEDRVEADDIVRAEQYIRDLGLFSAVKIEPHQDNGDTRLEVQVTEKHFNLILPKLSRNGEGDITTGITWRSANLFGLNQSAKLQMAYTDYSDTDNDNTVGIRGEYEYPRIKGGPYSLYLSLLNEKTRLEDEIGGLSGEYERITQAVEITGRRWLTKKSPSHGLQLEFGLARDNLEHTYISGARDLFPNPTNYILISGLNFFDVRDHHYSREGSHISYRLRLSDQQFGSDVSYLHHQFFYRRYLRLPQTTHSNLNFQLAIGATTRSVLGTPVFKVGDSRLLRGYDRDEVEGNSYLTLNTEWLRPIFRHKTLRAALFLDIGNAWPRLSDVKFGDLRYGTGFGLRWKLKHFVKTDVRLDVASGLSDGGETKVYLSTKATF